MSSRSLRKALRCCRSYSTNPLNGPIRTIMLVLPRGIKRMQIAKMPTELESCTLGVIFRHQPCSTYEVRRVFRRSPTPEWSASAGSIYPVIERLLRLNFVRAVSQASDSRGRRDLTVTKKGTRALQKWILNLEPWVARPTPDPIRTRVYFLASLEL